EIVRRPALKPAPVPPVAVDHRASTPMGTRAASMQFTSEVKPAPASASSWNAISPAPATKTIAADPVGRISNPSGRCESPSSPKAADAMTPAPFANSTASGHNPAEPVANAGKPAATPRPFTAPAEVLGLNAPASDPAQRPSSPYGQSSAVAASSQP